MRQNEQKPRGNKLSNVLQGLGVMAGSALAFLGIAAMTVVYIANSAQAGGMLTITGSAAGDMTMFASGGFVSVFAMSEGYGMVKKALGQGPVLSQAERMDRAEQAEIYRAKREQYAAKMPASLPREPFAKGKVIDDSAVGYTWKPRSQRPAR